MYSHKKMLHLCVLLQYSLAVLSMLLVYSQIMRRDSIFISVTPVPDNEFLWKE